jgi:transcriptional regulator with XRE-family HTH domain
VKDVAAIGTWWYDEAGVLKMGFAFGKLLRAKRRMARLSLTEAAKLAGVSHSYLSQLESGQKQRPSEDAKERLCAVLGITPEELSQVDWNTFDPLPPVRDVVRRGTEALKGLPDLIARAERLVAGVDHQPRGVTQEDAHKILSELQNLNRTVLPLLAEMSARLEPVRSKDIEALIGKLERLGPTWVQFLDTQVEGIKKLIGESESPHHHRPPADGERSTARRR